MGIPGVTFDGGYADYVLVKASALALIPDDLADEDAAPLLCAGITTYNALRNSGARGGDLVAILGVGGSAISASSSPPSLASAPWRSPAGPTRSRSSSRRSPPAPPTPK
jgi:hypothetical protein